MERYGRVGIAIAVAVGALWFLIGQSNSGPKYQGKSLRYWSGQRPAQYYTAVTQLGTNAIPYLMRELQATDPAIAQAAQKLLGKVIEIGDVFVFSRNRKYHARLGFNVLDTNAVPALLDTVFSAPLLLHEGNLPMECAIALYWCGSPAAMAMRNARLSTAVRDPDDQIKRNAMLAYPQCGIPTVEVSRTVQTYITNQNRELRDAAIYFFTGLHTNRDIAVPALTKAMDDREPELRMAAIYGLNAWGTNALSAVPALLNIYSNTPSTGLDNHNLRASIQIALRKIDPSLGF